MILYHGSKEIVDFIKFQYPTHQISFHTISALDTLQYIGSEEAYGKKR